MLMQMHGKKGLNGDGRLLRWFLVPLLPKPLHSVGAKRTHEPVGGRGPFGLIKVLKAGPEPKALDRYTVTGYRVVTR